MNTLLADPPAAPSSEQPPSPGPPDTPPPAVAPSTPACVNCGAPLDDGQDWCLQCGAGAPDSLGGAASSWRSAATILTATALLVVGAATAAYAALSEHGPARPRAVTMTVAQTPPPATPGTGVTPTTPVTPATPVTPGAPTTLTPPTQKTPKIPTTPEAANKLLFPPTGGKSQKVPLIPATPKGSGQTPTPSGSGGATTPKESGGGSNPPAEPKQTSILLDTNAAATYNPYGYPAAGFGDPSLAIDGDTSTGWTAQVDPARAPKLAEGLVIDLKTARRLSALALVTSSPGMTVQIYGAAGQALPASITDPAWARLSPALLAKHKERIKLKDAARSFRFVTVWISVAPAASVGTAQVPGHVSLNEVELFPAK
ncbi:MAG TPA: hypothetical protein VGG98_09570 [Solirubrobacteraceae bacterium]